MSITENNIGERLAKLGLLKSEIQKVIVGQEVVLEQLIISFLAGGHILLEGVPGLAKTLMVRTLAEALELRFKRIQFTPDLMPGDIIGTEILEEDHASRKRFFRFHKGPLFAHIILADEINRTPPRTQSALLEAMQEFEITYNGKTYPLDKPFFILATQNPIEQAGTYPLPEAQLDRFLLLVKIDYPTEEEEFSILNQTTGGRPAGVEPILDANQILELQTLVREVNIDAPLISWVTEIIRKTRPQHSSDPVISEQVRWGAGPRAGQALILTSKARALLYGRYSVIPEDIKAMAYPVLRHRILLNYKAENNGVTADVITAHLLETTPVPGFKAYR